MLNSSTLDKLSALRLHAMAQAWQDQQAHADHGALTFDERFGCQGSSNFPHPRSPKIPHPW